MTIAERLKSTLDFIFHISYNGGVLGDCKMFGFGKKIRPSKTFKVSYVLSSASDGGNIISFDKSYMNDTYIDCETIGEAASIFARRFFISNRSIFIYGIEELST